MPVSASRSDTEVRETAGLMTIAAQSSRAAWIASISTPSWLLCTARSSKPSADAASAVSFDVLQRGRAVDLGFAAAEEVEIRPVDEQNPPGHSPISW